jgi:hypothetical protein
VAGDYANYDSILYEYRFFEATTVVDGKDKCRVVARLGIFRAPASLARRSVHTEELRASTGIFVTALARFGYY